MSALVVFLTLFLGLASGEQPVELRADPSVESIRLLLGGREVATLKKPPWKTTIDLGELAPQELTAIGYNGTVEVGRASQTINLPRSPAEITIVVDRDAQSKPKAARLYWRHLSNAPIRSSTLLLDGSPLKLDSQSRAALPDIDVTTPHVLSAEVQFKDKTIAHRDTVFGGTWPETVEPQLTATLVRRTAAPEKPAERCFAAGGEIVRTAAVERPGALVVIVRDPNAAEAQMTLDPFARVHQYQAATLRHLFSLDRGSEMQFMWPVSRRFETSGAAPAELFENSPPINQKEAGLYWAITRASDDAGLMSPRRYADAVAVAGISAFASGHRRAVILIVGENDDHDISDYTPASVRRYLQAIGVPYYVWSLSPRRNAGAWGEAADISSFDKLRVAVNRVKADLESQRIAWIDAKPVAALNVEAKGACGYVPVATGK